MSTEQDRDNEPESYIERRNILLRDVPPEIIRKAWFTLSHLLLDDGAKVVDMGCDDGAMTYAMAAMNPKIKFIGLDKSKRQINKAREKYQLHNLSFKIGDVSAELFDPNSLDAIINSYILHGVYSGSRYNERIVSETLKRHFNMLKKGGMMFIRDYARPPPEEMVLLEMPDKPSAGQDLHRLSEPDFLIWYSQHARPRQDPGCSGFFLEELPQRFPGTRLFRLPHKWAYEFIMRKDDRSHWETELPTEYTFFTMREFRKELRALGARVQYSGPYWDEDIIEKNFEGHFKLYADNGTPLGNPATCYIAVAYKMAERKSLNIEERRPSDTDRNSLSVQALRDEHTGEIVEVVTRDYSVSEFLPYRVDEDGQLKIYLHDGVARSITNAVPRSGINLGGKRWSGHMVEALSVDTGEMAEYQPFDTKNTVRFSRDFLGLKPSKGALVEHGPDYFPAPDYIDERIQTWYLQVEKAHTAINPPRIAGQASKFMARGSVREMDAQQILNAITVGMIPNARLEMQILSLFNHLDIKAENWSSRAVRLQVGNVIQKKSLRQILDIYGSEKKRFRSVKGTTGSLRPVHSIFVEEGQTRGAVTGLSAQEIDFVVHDDRTINTAVVIPLTKDVKGDVHAGFLMKHLPVPERYGGSGVSVTAPSFNLPASIRNLKMAKQFIAEQFGVTHENVIKLGESYFTHLGVTPQKIHPFAVAVPPDFPKIPGTAFLPFYQMKLLRKSLSKDLNFMVVIARAYRYFNDEMRFEARLQAKLIANQRFAAAAPEWSTPLSYHKAPAFSEIKMPERASVLNQKHDEGFSEADEDMPYDGVFSAEKPEQEAVKRFQNARHKAPRLSDDFEKELEEFIETLEEEYASKPQPEKW